MMNSKSKSGPLENRTYSYPKGFKPVHPKVKIEKGKAYNKQPVANGI